MPSSLRQMGKSLAEKNKKVSNVTNEVQSEAKVDEPPIENTSTKAPRGRKKSNNRSSKSTTVETATSGDTTIEFAKDLLKSNDMVPPPKQETKKTQAKSATTSVKQKAPKPKSKKSTKR